MITSTENVIKVKYNQQRELYHIVNEKGQVDVPNHIKNSSKLHFYQVGQNVFHYDEAGQLLYFPGSNSPEKIENIIGIFSIEQKTYFYMSNGEIREITGNNYKVNVNMHCTFNYYDIYLLQQFSDVTYADVIKCSTAQNRNITLIVALILQGVLFLILIFFNIKFAADWLNVKHHGQVSLRIKSQPNRQSRQVSSSERASVVQQRRTTTSSATSSEVTSNPKPTIKKANKVATKPPPKPQTSGSSDLSRKADSVADCYKR